MGQILELDEEVLKVFYLVNVINVGVYLASYCFRFHIPGALWVEYNEIGQYYYDKNFNFTRSKNSRGYLKLSPNIQNSRFSDSLLKFPDPDNTKLIQSLSFVC